MTDPLCAGDLMVEVRATTYTVCALPLNDEDAHPFWITVEWRGDDRYAVCRSRRCLGADGEWSWESIPSEREDEWIATHRFDLDTALRLAEGAAPHVSVNGKTPADLINARIARGGEDDG